jgi:hypothetical protein
MGTTDHEEIQTVPSTPVRSRTAGLKELMETEIGAWPGVSRHPHRFGGVEFRYGRVELGHLHGGHLADLPMPRAIRDELVTAGRALPHHVLPDSGWVSRPIRGREDAEDVIRLFRLNYERILGRKQRAGTSSEGRPS